MERTRGIQLRPNPLRANTPGAYGQVLGNTTSKDGTQVSKGINLDEWTCDVRLWSGEIITKVKMPGAYFGTGGKSHGVLGGISENQLVYVEFAFGSTQNPIISEAYPYYAREKDSENFGIFLKKKKLKKDDIIIFHSSGYSVWMREFKIELYLDSNPVPIGFINIQTNTISFNMQMLLGTASVPNGDLLMIDLAARATFETQTKTAIDLIKTALTTAPTNSTVPLDNGAAYKAGITSQLGSLVSPTPVTPNPNIIKTNLKVSPT